MKSSDSRLTCQKQKMIVSHEKHSKNLFLFYFLGPGMPKHLEGHSMVSRDAYSLVIIGGWDGEHYSSDLYMLTCENRYCGWSYMNQRLSVGRAYATAISLPDSIAQCS